MRTFNITGPCRPDEHYMVDISGKLSRIRTMLERRQYFTINRARQYGKTTTLRAMRERFSADYVMALISFEGIGDEPFSNAASFGKIFLKLIQRSLIESSVSGDENYIHAWADAEIGDFFELGEHISKMCKGRKVVLLIDEVDRTSNNRVFIQFLGMLRDKFINRSDEFNPTFHSVVLAGVYDIRNIKLKMINEGVYSPNPQEGSIYNSPWNIAVPFDVDMSFNPAEIATMLTEYENDSHTGMDIPAISETIHYYTSGYPFLVSELCRLIDEKLDRNWTNGGIEKAVKDVLDEKNTLFDDLIKNLENYPDLYDIIYNLLMVGDGKNYRPSEPLVSRAMMFGIIQFENGKPLVANRIFEIYITDYMVSKDELQNKKTKINSVLKDDVIKDGRFDMELAVRKFAQQFRKLFNERDAAMVERDGKFIFICYLSPLLYGGGFYHFESQLADYRRMDIVVDYGTDEFIIELKIWRGEKEHSAAYEQLAGYLKSRGASTGYLITFDLREEGNRLPAEHWVTYEGLRIFDAVI